MSEPVRVGRALDELRPVAFQRGIVPHAEGSCIVETGRTRVLCTATVEETVPDWRAGGGAGWVTAEYAMLPRSTSRRTGRERTGARGRTQEIQRLIGRALRAATDLAALGERTVLIDCDVLIADGGTRTASITGAALALHDACQWLVQEGRVPESAMKQLVAATSVGIIAGQARVDLDYIEDVAADVDMNIVALEDGRLIEVQGTAEGAPFSTVELGNLVALGADACRRLFDMQRAVMASAPETASGP